ncbi:hypothetical protein FQN57_002889 [Myotisia sp. PD_48]|nr:hypothetical protein FQN57_002889 [Myotisia sp. PD_48]
MATPAEKIAASIAKLSQYQISRFFQQQVPLTQQECNSEAERITGVSSIRPTAVQGGNSYTVIAGTKVVQFRETVQDLQLLKCCEEVYAGFTPQYESAGKLGNAHIYVMNDVGGISMYLARGQLPENNCELLQKTLQEYARLVNSLIYFPNRTENVKLNCAAY